MKIEEKIKAMGLEIPEAPKPVAAYVPAVKSGKLVFTSGQLPFKNGDVALRGKVGQQIKVEEGYAAAQICALNCLSVIKGVIGDLDNIKRIVKVVGFVNCDGDFTGQPQVLNGASELLGKIFDEAGQHARSAVGVASLPMNAAVEVEMIVEVE